MSLDDIIKKITSNRITPRLDFSIKHKTEEFTNNLFHTLFDAISCVAQNIDKLTLQFAEIYNLACFDTTKPCTDIWDNFLQKLPQLLNKLNLDAAATMNNDPAANSIEEVYLSYPGFFTIAIYRFSHELYLLNVPLIPRLMNEYAHKVTGIDINPGATIGDAFHIDHGTGVVIGETAIIKNNVNIYQGVTLGGLYVAKNLESTKRHPTIENNVTIYANATILGGETIIGANSTIGGNVWLTESVPENSIVYHTPETKIKIKNS
jgi:serine O-acetyltransferase